jgi:hypothetical protein
MAKSFLWLEPKLGWLTGWVLALPLVAGVGLSPEAKGAPEQTGILERSPSAPARAARGYLAMVGPSPLHFQSPASPRPAVVLPPLPPPQAQGSQDGHKAPPEAAPDSIPPASPPKLPVAEPPAPQRQTTSSLTNAEPDTFITLPGAKPVEPAGVISPQLLLEFFRPFQNGTNGVRAAALVPVQFVPPASVPSPSSRATYRVE